MSIFESSCFRFCFVGGILVIIVPVPGQIKFCDIFLIFAQNIECGYTLEPLQ